VGVFAVLVVAAIPVLGGRYLPERFSSVREDLGVRLDHWRDVLARREQGVGTALFGLGLGRFPEVQFWRTTSGTARASYGFATRADGGTHLQLGSAGGLYFEQFVPVERGGRYVTTLAGRSDRAGARIAVSLCEKLIVYPGHCRDAELTLRPEWTSQRVELSADDLGGDARVAARPVKLVLSSLAAATVIEVDDISLRDGAGRELVRNGGFARGLDHWFYSADSHLDWHAKNFALHLLFEQGWVGLASFALLVVLAAAKLVGQLATRIWAPAFLAALAGMLSIGCFDSVIDAPRHLLLLLLLVLMPFASPEGGGRDAGMSKTVTRDARREA
jgi:hypothetical protein